MEGPSALKDVPRPTFFLIDAMYQIYRAFHAIRGLSTRKGLPTNAVFGFVKMLLRVQDTYSPDLLAAVFDTEHPTFRSEAFEAYKAHRKPMPEDLGLQIPYVKRACRALGVPVMELPGYEADDVIGTLAVSARQAGYYPVIVSNDKDLYQLIGSGTYMLQAKRTGEVFIDEQGVRDRFGADPAKVPDVLGLWGDQSDNIPGVPGIGEKWAKELIGRFGSLDGVYSGLQSIESRAVRSRIEKNRELAYFSRDMATIRSNLALDFEPEKLAAVKPDRHQAYDLFTELEFESLRREYAPSSESALSQCTIVADADALRAMVGAMEQAGRFGLRVVADAPDPVSARLSGLALSAEPGRGFYVPVRQGRGPSGDQTALEAVAPLLESEDVGKIGHDLKAAWILLHNRGVTLRGLRDDVRIASYVLDPTGPSHDLVELAWRHLNIRRGGEAAFAPSSLFDGSEPEQSAARRAVDEADIALRLGTILETRLRDGDLKTLYDEIEMPLVEVLAAMEACGVKIDRGVLAELGARFAAELDALTKAIHALAGCVFNINSPAQLGEILFDKLKLPARKKTQKQRRYSTDIEVLTELAAIHELPRKVLEYRQLAKLKSTYIDAIGKLVDPATGRLHTSYNQTVTATGRLSSSEPNLQNIPIRTAVGREIRKAFVAEEGFVLLSCDYSQIELRVLAHISGDERLREAFHRDEDVHTRTAAELYDIPVAMVTSEVRRNAKALIFGIIYGMSAYGLAKELGLSQGEAQRIIDRYFERYPGVRTFVDRAIEDLVRTGTTRTLFNRVRAVPEIRSKKASLRGFAERVAVNTPIQGTAADLIKLAMIRVQSDLNTRASRSRMIMQVHDELVFEVPSEEASDEAARIVHLMETVHPLAVPLKVDVTMGKSWFG